MEISQAGKRVAALLAIGMGLVTTGCHYAAHTAGRPGAENDGTPGSTVASKEGTGDAKVGSGAGQVGTDAPEKSVK